MPVPGDKNANETLVAKSRLYAVGQFRLITGVSLAAKIYTVQKKGHMALLKSSATWPSIKN